MESFDIRLLEDRFTIEPQENGLYHIMEGENKVGVIYTVAEGARCSGQLLMRSRMVL